MKKIVVAVLATAALSGCATDMQAYYNAVAAMNKERAAVMTAEANARAADAAARKANADVLVEIAKNDKASDAVRIEAARQAGQALVVQEMSALARGNTANQVAAMTVPPPPKSEVGEIAVGVLKAVLFGAVDFKRISSNERVQLANIDASVRLREVEGNTMANIVGRVADGNVGVAQAGAIKIPTINAGGSVVFGGGTANGANSGANSGNSGTIGNENRNGSPNVVCTAAPGGNATTGSAGNGGDTDC